MSDSGKRDPTIIDPREQVKAIRELIRLVDSGEAVSAAIRLVRRDGTIQDIVFARSDQEAKALLEDLRGQIRRAMH